MTTERDVTAALGEVEVLREQGLRQVDNPERWRLTLVAAESASKRAEGLLATGESTDLLRERVGQAKRELSRDEQDRSLLSQLDRIGDENEIRLLLPVNFTSVTARKYASAFRTAGLDLTRSTTTETVAWLKHQRFRDRLVLAIRRWRFSLPFNEELPGAGYGPSVSALEAVGGQLAGVALLHHPTQAVKLDAILKAMTVDSFTRQWWEAVEKKDLIKLKELLKQPAIARLTSRELASLAEGVSPFSGLGEALPPLLVIAQQRFPGEFWVHFRLAFVPLFNSRGRAHDKDPDAPYRHLTAALAIRPNSAIARSAPGMEMLDKGKDEAAGQRWLESAAKVDPKSPWPHLLLGMDAMDKQDWPKAFRTLKEAVRRNPDTAFFMLSSAPLFMHPNAKDASKHPTGKDIVRELNEMIALHPKHPGGYEMLGRYYLQASDHRAALAALRKSGEFTSPDYPVQLLRRYELANLEAEVLWKEKLPGVIRGEIKPADRNELRSLTSYCATFEKKFALATRIASDAIKANPQILDSWFDVGQFGGWAAQSQRGPRG